MRPLNLVFFGLIFHTLGIQSYRTSGTVIGDDLRRRQEGPVVPSEVRYVDP